MDRMLQAIPGLVNRLVQNVATFCNILIDISVPDLLLIDMYGTDCYTYMRQTVIHI